MKNLSIAQQIVFFRNLMLVILCSMFTMLDFRSIFDAQCSTYPMTDIFDVWYAWCSIWSIFDVLNILYVLFLICTLFEMIDIQYALCSTCSIYDLFIRIAIFYELHVPVTIETFLLHVNVRSTHTEITQVSH